MGADVTSPSKPRVPIRSCREPFEELDIQMNGLIRRHSLAKRTDAGSDWPAEESGKTHSGRASVGRPDCTPKTRLAVNRALANMAGGAEFASDDEY